MTFKLRKITSILFSAAVLTLVGAVAATAAVLPGDADGDGDVTIIDATCIQRKLAGMPVTENYSPSAADIDNSGEVEITDATFIRRWLAGIETPYQIGELPETPTEAPTQAPTQIPTDEEGWGREIFRP